MNAETVLEILALLDSTSVGFWLDGGWAVDALLGEQTRAHSDLDLIVRSRDCNRLRLALAANGLVVREHGSPNHMVLEDQHMHVVDVHVITFDARGFGLFQLSDGRVWPFPAEAFHGRGRIRDREVPCLTAEAQVQCHGQGYEPSENDLHDMEQLQAKFGVVLPLHLCSPRQ
jgi:lincosamide nucleotidyltransferase A/C/D/E